MSDHQPTDIFNFLDPFTTYQYNLLAIPATPAPTSAYHQSNSYTNVMSASMSFSESLDGSQDYNTLARAFGMSSSSPEELFPMAVSNGGLLSYGKVQEQAAPGTQKMKGLGDNGQGERGNTVGGDQILASPGPHSICSSESEASGGIDEDSRKEHKIANEDEDGVSSKKKNKQNNKKGDKRLKEPRFAFMTKSEVDHMEDGYRWRKYGQKAVKNSPYPRSYYRCTTQKCNVKKRVERSFQDPLIVITTYEGQHNHPIPTTLRGSYNSPGLILPPPISLSPAAFNIRGGQGGSFINPHDLLHRLPHHYCNPLAYGSTLGYNNDNISPALRLSSLHQQPHQRRQQPLLQADYGLLQDMVNPNTTYGEQEPP